MAKRRKTKHRVHHRRRRVGAIGGKLNLPQLGEVIAGAAAGSFLSKKLSASTNATMVKAAPYSSLILGIVLPMLVKSDLIKNVSLGLVANGGVSVLGPGGLKVLSGFENSIAGLGYPYYSNRQNLLPSGRVMVNGIGNTAGNQGLTKGTRSNFSGSRNSQMQTIAGIGCNCDGSGSASSM